MLNGIQSVFLCFSFYRIRVFFKDTWEREMMKKNKNNNTGNDRKEKNTEETKRRRNWKDGAKMNAGKEEKAEREGYVTCASHLD